MEGTLQYYFWKLVKWGAVFAVAGLVATHPDQAANLVIRIGDFVFAIGAGCVHIVLAILNHFSTKV